jgi:Fic family protein
MAKAKEQQPWFLPEPAIVPVSDGGRFLAITGRLDRFSGQWLKLKSQAPDQIEELRVIATIESVASSTRIEGAQLSNEQVRQVLEGVRIDSFRARDQQEVRGYRDLLELFRTQHAELKITETMLKEFHRVLLVHSEKDTRHRGDYKRGPNHVEIAGDGGPPVVVFRTAPPAETRWWMERIIAELNSAWDDPQWHRLLLIADFILWFLAIHPFEDGNGRLARALTNLLLLRAGYEYVPYASLESVIEDRKADYYIALQTSQVAARDKPAEYGKWVDFFLRALEAQQQVLMGRLNKVAQRQRITEPRVRILDVITERGPMTTPEIAAALGMSERTVRYHLVRLRREHLLEAPARMAGRRYGLPLSAVQTPSVPSAVSTSPGPESELPSAPDREQLLTPLDFAPALQQQVMANPNGRAYATVVIVGATSPIRSPLGDGELDAMERFASALAPDAVALRATPEVAWWSIADAPHLDKLQLWLYPGPLVQVHWALDATDAPDDGLIAVDPVGLVAFWRHVLGHAVPLCSELGISTCVLGLNVQTVPSGRPTIVDLDLTRVPRPTRSGAAESVPPWSAQRIRVDSVELSDDSVLRPAMDQLLRHFSYRHTAPTLDATFGTAGAAWDASSVPSRILGRRGTRQQPSAAG